MAESDSWTFLTNHGHVLLSLARDPQLRLRDLAEQVGITERSAQKIVTELQTAGYLAKTKTGRRNVYQVNPQAHFRHPIEADHLIGELLSIFGGHPHPPTRHTARRHTA